MSSSSSATSSSPPPQPTAQTWIPGCCTEMVTQGIVPKAHDKAVIMCSSELKRVVGSLKSAFPPNALHGFAIKSNVLSGVLKLLNEEGMGAEAASTGEFTLATRCFPPEKIIFDSPMKTLQELEIAAYTPGSYLNLDNFQELERVADMHKVSPVKAHIGLRINPQTAEGSIATLSTGMATSKFGIGMVDYRQELIEAYTSKYKDFLSMIHIHTGSQGVGIPLMVQGVKAIVALAEEINSICSGNGSQSGEGNLQQQQVTIIDIGGGLPVNFGSAEFKPTFQEYGDALREAVPALFSKQQAEDQQQYRYKILTEFGRAVCAKAGFIASKVEYTKTNGGRRIISQHIGADLAVRTIWAPKEWVLRVNVIDGITGDERTDDVDITDVAGPCCLGGDLTVKATPLPKAFPGDVIVHKDTGGYYHSGYSTYNLRPPPACYLFDEEKKEFTCIKKEVAVDELLSLISA